VGLSITTVENKLLKIFLAVVCEVKKGQYHSRQMCYQPIHREICTTFFSTVLKEVRIVVKHFLNKIKKYIFL